MASAPGGHRGAQRLPGSVPPQLHAPVPRGRLAAKLMLLALRVGLLRGGPGVAAARLTATERLQGCARAVAPAAAVLDCGGRHRHPGRLLRRPLLPPERRPRLLRRLLLVLTVLVVTVLVVHGAVSLLLWLLLQQEAMLRMLRRMEVQRLQIDAHLQVIVPNLARWPSGL